MKPNNGLKNPSFHHAAGITGLPSSWYGMYCCAQAFWTVISANPNEMIGTMTIKIQPMPRHTGWGRSMRDFGVLIMVGEYFPICHLSNLDFACIFYCLNDLVIACATTQVAGDGLFDFVLRGVRFFFEQFCGRHDKARCAISALDCAILNESFLHGM